MPAKIEAQTLRRVVAEIPEGERPEFKSGERTTFVVMRMTVEESWPSGDILRVEAEGYRLERANKHPATDDYVMTHSAFWTGGRAPKPLHDLIGQMRRYYEKPKEAETI